MFSRIGLTQRYLVELAADVSYIGSYLMEDANSSWWRVFHVGQLIKLAAGILQVVYDIDR